MKLVHRVPTLIPFLLAGALGAGACASTPEGPGDSCEPDGERCPGELVCAPGGDDHICQIPAGGQCDPAAEDFCLAESTCVKTDTGGVCGIPEGGECEPANSYCTGELECAELTSGGHACHAPVLVKGMVFDASSEAAIEGAHVLALDEQSTAVTDVALSDAAGDYALSIPVPRGDDGAPAEGYIFTLRASAADYQTFPGGLRTALPINTGQATAAEGGWVIDAALTDVALIQLPEAERGRASISGAVLAGDLSGGVLVVAEAGGSGISAISDKAGSYTIFNVPDGDHTVNGYAAGVQLDPVAASVAGAALTGIDLAASEAALGTISGSLSIVNAPGGSTTSVVLVVASTFSDTFVRGEVPRGLRTPLSGPPDVSGAFSISGVPAGSYVVLAAFENDDLVRDPDPNISGTQIVTVDMKSPGTDVSLDSGFKITEALALIGPGANEPEAVTEAPTLSWADDSSEDFYSVQVFNAYGEMVWEDANVPSVSGGGNVSVKYAGPMEAGMYYQFRATSWRAPGGKKPGAISTTEDLRGVFYVAK